MVRRNSYLDRVRELFAEAKSTGDWSGVISSDGSSLCRKKIFESCSFPRSTIYQNTGVKELIAQTEMNLISLGILVGSRYKKELAQSDVNFEDELLGRISSLNNKMDLMEVRLSGMRGRLEEM